MGGIDDARSPDSRVMGLHSVALCWKRQVALTIAASKRRASLLIHVDIDEFLLFPDLEV